MRPVSIKVLENKFLLIKWNDQTQTNIKLETLRKFCPCATCIRERDDRGKSYIPIYNPTQSQVANIEVIGSYAIQIRWKDGHDTGIYEYPFLKNLDKK